MVASVVGTLPPTLAKLAVGRQSRSNFLSDKVVVSDLDSLCHAIALVYSDQDNLLKLLVKKKKKKPLCTISSGSGNNEVSGLESPIMRGHGRACSLVVKTCCQPYDSLKGRSHGCAKCLWQISWTKYRQHHLLTLRPRFLEARSHSLGLEASCPASKFAMNA